MRTCGKHLKSSSQRTVSFRSMPHRPGHSSLTCKQIWAFNWPHVSMRSELNALEVGPGFGIRFTVHVSAAFWIPCWYMHSQQLRNSSRPRFSSIYLPAHSLHLATASRPYWVDHGIMKTRNTAESCFRFGLCQVAALRAMQVCCSSCLLVMICFTCDILWQSVIRHKASGKLGCFCLTEKLAGTWSARPEAKEHTQMVIFQWGETRNQS